MAKVEVTVLCVPEFSNTCILKFNGQMPVYSNPTVHLASKSIKQVARINMSSSLFHYFLASHFFWGGGEITLWHMFEIDYPAPRFGYLLV